MLTFFAFVGWFALLWFGVLLMAMGCGCMFMHKSTEPIFIFFSGVTIFTIGFIVGGIAWSHLQILLGIG